VPHFAFFYQRSLQLPLNVRFVAALSLLLLQVRFYLFFPLRRSGRVRCSVGSRKLMSGMGTSFAIPFLHVPLVERRERGVGPQAADPIAALLTQLMGTRTRSRTLRSATTNFVKARGAVTT
jgi:hypothetical protein